MSLSIGCVSVSKATFPNTLTMEYMAGQRRHTWNVLLCPVVFFKGPSVVSEERQLSEEARFRIVFLLCFRLDFECLRSN